MRPTHVLLTTVAVAAVLGLALVAVPQLPLPAFASDPEPDGQGWLGVRLQELTPDLRESLHVDRRVDGVLVSSVVDGSPAAEAGLEPEDIITEIQGTRVATVEEAVDAVRDLSPGQKVLITVNRSGRTRGLSAVLGNREEAREQGRYDRDVRRWYGEAPEPPRPPQPPQPPRPPRAPRPPHAPHVEIHRLPGGYLGVQTFPLNEQLAAYFGVPEGQGVLVTEVMEDSPAEGAGLRAGDVILAVGEVEIDGPRDLRRAVRSHDPEETVPITVNRRGETHTFEVTLADAKDMSGGFHFWGGDLEDLADLSELEELEALEALEDIELPDVDVILESLPRFEWYGDEDGESPHIYRYYFDGNGTEWREIGAEAREAVKESLEAAREQLERVRVEVLDARSETLEQLREHMERLREDENRLREEENRIRRSVPPAPGATGTI